MQIVGLITSVSCSVARYNDENTLFYLVCSQPVTGRPPTRMTIPDAVQYNFELLMMSTQCSKHVEAYNKLIIKQDFVHYVG